MYSYALRVSQTYRSHVCSYGDIPELDQTPNTGTGATLIQPRLFMWLTKWLRHDLNACFQRIVRRDLDSTVQSYQSFIRDFEADA